MVYWIGPIYNGEGRPVYRRRTWVAWLPLGAATPVFKASGHTVQVLNLLIDEGLLPKYGSEQVAELKTLATSGRAKLQNCISPNRRGFGFRYRSVEKWLPVIGTGIGGLTVIGVSILISLVPVMA